MNKVVTVSVIAALCCPHSAGAVTDLDPVFTCHYSAYNQRIDGEWLGGFPTQLNEAVKQTGMTAVPYKVYAGKITPRCNIVLDADNPLPNGAYNLTLCSPPDWATKPNTPPCGQWRP